MNFGLMIAEIELGQPEWGLLFGSYILLSLTIVLPVIHFLIRGWQVRKDDVLGEFSEEAARHYLKAFCMPDWKYEKNSSKTGKQELEQVYVTRFARRVYLIPILLLCVIVFVSLEMCREAAVAWLSNGTFSVQKVLPLETVLAILGGCFWVSTDAIARFRRNDFSPADVYWHAFRIVFSPALAYALSKIELLDAISIPVSFLLGTFPTETVVSIARRTVGKKLGLDGIPDNEQGQLQKIPAIDADKSDRFIDEGITNIVQLASLDPVRMSIRTGLPFSYIMQCVSEAIVQNFFAEKSADVRKMGLRSALEFRNLWIQLQSAVATEQQRGKDVVTSVKNALSMDEAIVRKIVDEIAQDSFTIFLFLCWRPKDDRNSIPNKNDSPPKNDGQPIIKTKQPEQEPHTPPSPPLTNQPETAKPGNLDGQPLENANRPADPRPAG